jgi:hypothetical protein
MDYIAPIITASAALLTALAALVTALAGLIWCRAQQRRIERTDRAVNRMANGSNPYSEDYRSGDTHRHIPPPDARP